MDTTWSVRIPEEMREKISTMITDSGLNSKEFLTQAIQVYELKAARKLQPIMETDIDELTQITGRIHNIFINLCERITNFQRQKSEEFGLKLKEKDDMIAVFNDRIKNQEKTLMDQEEEAGRLKKQFNEMHDQCINLNDVCEANKALISEYREKNETLTDLLGEYKEYKSMVDSIKKELEKERDSRQSAELIISESNSKIAKLNAQLIESKKAFQTELTHKLDLCEIQKEKAILEIKKECQQNLETAQKEYTEKVKELLEMIEAQKKAGTTKKTPGKSSSVSRKQP